MSEWPIRLNGFTGDGPELDRMRDHADRALAEVERLRAELAGWEERYPCDGLCREYPEEDCSRHGRRPDELWAAISEIQGRYERLRAVLANVEARVEAWEDPDWAGHLTAAAFARAIRAALASVPEPSEPEPHAPEVHVEIGGQRMTEAQFDAARRPLEEPCFDDVEPSEPEQCPHVAEPGSRHEDEDCCVEDRAAAESGA